MRMLPSVLGPLLCWTGHSAHSASLCMLWRDRLPWPRWWRASHTQRRESHQAHCPFTLSLGLGLGPLPVKWLLLSVDAFTPHKDLLLMHLLEAKHSTLLSTASG